MSARRLMRGMLCFWLVSIFNFSAHAPVEEVDMAEESAPEVSETVEGQTTGALPAIYLPLKPAFVVNYGGKGHLRYLKTELSVRLASTEAANSVRHHMPWIRNNLVMLFARQTEESINSQEGREQLRQDALAEIRKVVKEEDALEGVIDVYFNTFIVQN